MRKTMMLFLTGLLLAATLAHAGNGDLIVDGKVMIGSADSLVLPSSSTITLGTNWGDGMLYFNNGGSNILTFDTVGGLGGNGYQGIKANMSYQAPDGALWNPGFGFMSQQGVGIFRPASNTLGFVTGNTQQMTIAPNGYVGIGTTTPAFKLDVQGTIGSNNAPVLTSDIKFKKNLLPITTPLDKVLSLIGLTYEWKTDEYNEKNFQAGRHYGVIAQEIEKVLPEVVNTAPDGSKAVAYTEIIPVLIEAIKEQQKQIDELKKKVANLQ